MRRGSMVCKVVLLAVDHPGLLDAERMAWRLAPLPPKHLPDTGEFGVWRYDRDAWRQSRETWKTDSERIVADWVPKVREGLKSARKAGLLLPATHCRLDRHTWDAIQRSGIDVVRDFWWSSDDYRDSDRCITDGPRLAGKARLIIEALMEGPLRPSELRAATGGLTPRGNERGAWRRTWERLAQDGAVVPPSIAWPTPMGLAEAQRLRPRARATRAA